MLIRWADFGVLGLTLIALATFALGQDDNGAAIITCVKSSCYYHPEVVPRGTHQSFVFCKSECDCMGLRACLPKAPSGDNICVGVAGTCLLPIDQRASPPPPPTPPPRPPPPAPEACPRPVGWCTDAGDLFGYLDCDADGLADSLCVSDDANGGERVALLSSLFCDNATLSASSCPAAEPSCDVPQYTFFPHFDIVAHNLRDQAPPPPPPTANETAALCSASAWCLGFNTDGWLKDASEPLTLLPSTNNPITTGLGCTESGYYMRGDLIPVSAIVDLDNRTLLTAGSGVDSLINYSTPLASEMYDADVASNWASFWSPSALCDACGTPSTYHLLLAFPTVARVASVTVAFALLVGQLSEVAFDFPAIVTAYYAADDYAADFLMNAYTSDLGTSMVMCANNETVCQATQTVVFPEPFYGASLYLTLSTDWRAMDVNITYIVGKVYCYNVPQSKQQTPLGLGPMPPFPPLPPSRPPVPPGPPPAGPLQPAPPPAVPPSLLPLPGLSSSKSGTGSNSSLPVWSVVVIAVSAALLLAAGLVAICLYRRRHRAAATGRGGGGIGKTALSGSAASGAVLMIHSPLHDGVDDEAKAIETQAATPPSSSWADSFDRSKESLSCNMFDMMKAQKAAAAAAANGAVGGGIDGAMMAQMVGAQQTFSRDIQLELFEVLGDCGRGVVRRGLWKGHLPVAAKITVLIGAQPNSFRRQAMEVLMSSGLCHPNIVVTFHHEFRKLVDTEDQRGSTGAGAALMHMWQLIILQELCVGGSLRQVLEARGRTAAAGAAVVAGAFPAAVTAFDDMVHVLQLANDIASGLEHLHSKNMAHSDLKPDNVLLQKVPGPERGAGLRWTAKVADFGLSVVFDEGRTHASNMFCGTYHYIAPETKSEGVLSKQSDIYSLGLLLYEMACGRCPVLKLCSIDQLLAELDRPPPAAASISTLPSSAHQSSSSNVTDVRSAKLGIIPATAQADGTNQARGDGLQEDAVVVIVEDGKLSLSDSTTTASFGQSCSSQSDYSPSHAQSSPSHTHSVPSRSEISAEVASGQTGDVAARGDATADGGGGHPGGAEPPPALGSPYPPPPYRQSYGVPGTVPPIPVCYPADFRALVRECISAAPHRRPTVGEVKRRLALMAQFAVRAATGLDEINEQVE